MKTLHIFNCDTDYALADGTRFYTPPKNVIGVRNRLTLTPARYAATGDAILVYGDISRIASLPYYDSALSKELELITPEDNLTRYIPRPWGWNHSIRQFLTQHGVKEDYLPDWKQIDILRTLSHRRTTIQMLNAMQFEYQLPAELTTEEEIMQWCLSNPGGYLKAPWSSSGRGIYRVLSGWRNDIQSWCRGVLRRQGSILAEPGWNNQLDFATEWEISPRHEVRFIGYSVFHTDNHSQYIDNLKGSQSQLINHIDSVARGRLGDTLAKQKAALEAIIAPYYYGPLGIDCLVDASGKINPCVEINLRLTMGRVEIDEHL